MRGFQKVSARDKSGIQTWVSREYLSIISLLATVQPLSQVWLFETPWTAAHQAPLSFTIPWSSLKLMSTKPAMPPNRLIVCHPYFSSLQPSPASGSFPMSWFFISSSCVTVISFSFQGNENLGMCFEEQILWVDRTEMLDLFDQSAKGSMKLKIKAFQHYAI